MSADTERTDRIIELALSAGENKARRRIRRAQAKHLLLLRDTVAYLRRHGHEIAAQEIVDQERAIDAATRASRPRRLTR